ncbi:hypothetical protein [Sinomonas susongensis]|uniref:hypothetical protein n=1 Tax=Sinomonas susongensis TaxID=1324851 RepID=UPI00110976DB|nr:hypothetical protein [Sinomonas susongensis]
MATLVVLIVVSAVILAMLCLGNALAVQIRRLRARRDADEAIERLYDYYRDALREIHRRR